MQDRDRISGLESQRSSAEPTRAQNLRGWTILRAVAAVLVFFYHFQLTNDGAAIEVIGSNGFVGVSFFYLLSGAVLAWNWNPTGSRRTFYVHRFARIYPLYAVALVGAWLVNVLQGDGLDLSRLLANAAMVQAWIPDESYYFGIQAVFWSLSAEAFFYIMFPFFFPWLTRMSGGRSDAFASAAVVAVVAVAAVGSLDYDGAAVWFVYIFPPVRFLEFFLGAWLGLALKRGRLPTVPLLPAGLLVLAGYALIGQVPAAFRPAAVLLVPLAVFLVAAGQREIARPATFRRWPWLVQLGSWSFGFYLIHLSAIGAIDRIDVGLPSLVTALLVAALTFAVAAVAYRVVEVPMRKALLSRYDGASEPVRT